MRVLTGTLKGREIPSDIDVSTRPLTGILKQSLFDRLQGRIEGSVIYDIFAGSGGFGIEALSNGAKMVIFVDISRKNCATISRFLTGVNIANYKTLSISYDKISSQTICEFPPDIVIADPPYAMAGNNAVADKIFDDILNMFRGNRFTFIYRLFSKVKLSRGDCKTVTHGQDTLYILNA